MGKPGESADFYSEGLRGSRAAERVGAESYFSTEEGPAITDDHTPFLRDGLDLLSRRSVDAVGETIVQLVGKLRGE